MEQKYQPTGKTYTVKTIKQLAALVTEENLPFIMADLKLTFDALLAVDNFAKASHELAGMKHKKVTMPAWEWIDDGKSELTEIRLTDKSGDGFSINKDSFKDA